MKRIIILFFLVNLTAHAQEAAQNADNYPDDEYYDSGTAGGITIYGELEPIDAHVLNQLNGSLSERRRFIESEFLEGAGFRRTADAQYRSTNSTEKALSLLHGFGNVLSFGIIPMKPFSVVEHDRLPRGEYYRFESVFVKSNFTNVTPEVLTLMELEYMLQIEFFYGTIIHDNMNYYTDENIGKFERLILSLPDSPENIYQAKNRFSIALEKIKAAFERYRNPSEDYLRALQNLWGR